MRPRNVLTHANDANHVKILRTHAKNWPTPLANPLTLATHATFELTLHVTHAI